MIELQDIEYSLRIISVTNIPKPIYDRIKQITPSYRDQVLEEDLYSVDDFDQAMSQEYFDYNTQKTIKQFIAYMNEYNASYIRMIVTPIQQIKPDGKIQTKDRG